jgi:hypothetical protein
MGMIWKATAFQNPMKDIQRMVRTQRVSFRVGNTRHLRTRHLQKVGKKLVVKVAHHSVALVKEQRIRLGFPVIAIAMWTDIVVSLSKRWKVFSECW